MDMFSTDEIEFAEEDGGQINQIAEGRWKILIVDDEEDIHKVTEIALSGVKVRGRAIEFLHAYSGSESVRLLKIHADVALIFMDVVMESDHAGLAAVNQIRNELGNHQVRIVLRTGQAGLAPEREVITRYDINDYRDKTEITAQKMFTLAYTSLSLYGDLRASARSRNSLEQLVSASSTIFQCKVSESLAHGILILASTLLVANDPMVKAPPLSGWVLAEVDDRWQTLACCGHHGGHAGQWLNSEDSLEVDRALAELAPDQPWHCSSREFIARFKGSGGEQFVLHLQTGGVFDTPEPGPISLFCQNAASALQSAQLHLQINTTQRELIVMLSEAIEKRSRETGNHVRRVGEYSRLLGQLYGLHEHECETLLIAAPLHDAGKIAIPDAILNKPGRHTSEETQIMRTHAMIGSQIFSAHSLPVLKAAAILAGQHHERWDGLGYPLGLAGEAIHIYGRIVALADVFDALGSARCYKAAWELEPILQLLREQSGLQFEARLVDLLLGNLPLFLAIRDRYVDVFEESAVVA